jgi:hypothetical protein
MNYSNLDNRLKARSLSQSFLERLEQIREASLVAVQKAKAAKAATRQSQAAT